MDFEETIYLYTLYQWFVKESSPDFAKIQDIFFELNNFCLVWTNATLVNN